MTGRDCKPTAHFHRVCRDDISNLRHLKSNFLFEEKVRTKLANFDKQVKRDNVISWLLAFHHFIKILSSSYARVFVFTTMTAKLNTASCHSLKEQHEQGSNKSFQRTSASRYTIMLWLFILNRIDPVRRLDSSVVKRPLRVRG